jgi:hypothetical protein
MLESVVTDTVTDAIERVPIRPLLAFLMTSTLLDCTWLVYENNFTVL